MRSGEASVRRNQFQVSRGGSLRGVNAIKVAEKINKVTPLGPAAD